MGYTTEFFGSVSIDPPLNEAEISYINDFSNSRRMDRDKGPYYIGKGFMGQDIEYDVRNYNSPPEGQPGLWCHWEVTEDGTAIEWNGSEKFYSADRWLKYIIDHFLSSGAEVQQVLYRLRLGDEEIEKWDLDGRFLEFTFDHKVNGIIEAQGEDTDDRWRLEVENNTVYVREGEFVYESYAQEVK